MMSQRLNLMILFYFLLSTLLLLNPDHLLAKSYSSNDYNPLKIQIKMEKTTFEVGEPIEGWVIVHNSYPANVPAIFHVRLFHDGKLEDERTTSIPHIPEGTTDFSFKNFGIPVFNDRAGTEGEWRITIVQQNRDASDASETMIRIVPSREQDSEEPPHE